MANIPRAQPIKPMIAEVIWYAIATGRVKSSSGNIRGVRAVTPIKRTRALQIRSYLAFCRTGRVGTVSYTHLTLPTKRIV